MEMEVTKKEATSTIVETLRSFYLDGEPGIDIVIGVSNGGYVRAWADADADKENMYVGLFATAHAGSTWSDPSLWDEDFLKHLHKQIANWIENSVLAQVKKTLHWKCEKSDE